MRDAEELRDPATPVPAGAGLDFGRWALVIVGVVTLVGSLPRLFDLGGPSFWNDEGASSLFALAALKSGVPVLTNHPVANQLVNSDPLYAEVEAAAFWGLGVGQFAARIPAAVFGILAIPVSYLLGRRLKDPHVGIALAILMSFSTEYIAWSRQARGYSLFTLLLILTGLVLLSRPAVRGLNRRWIFPAAAVGGALLCGLASPGLTLLYIPGLLVGVGAFYLVRYRRRVAAWFGLSRSTIDALIKSSTTRIWIRRVVALVAMSAVVALWLFPPKILSNALDGFFHSTLGYAPYRYVFISRYATYLIAYYWPVTFLAALGALLVIHGRRETEIAVLAFFLGALLTLSTLLSYVVNVAGGEPVYERYLTPLLVFLFYFAARGLVGIAGFVWRRVREVRQLAPRPALRAALMAVGVVALLIVPSALIPSGENTYALRDFSPSGSLVPWVEFTAWPSDPSALFDTPQPNFAGASAYVVAHRLPGDVTMAIWPDAPAFYLGTVQYWIYATPPPGPAIPVPGGFEYYLTGSRLVSNVTELETVLAASPGWLLLDTNSIGALGTNLSIAVNTLLDPIPAASDVSITLYHWNQSANLGLLLDIESHRPDLRLAFGGNVTALVDWAAVHGVTTDAARVLFLPLEPLLTNLTTPAVRPLAVLLSVFNHRPDLGPRFPTVLAGNFTALLRWGAQVATGQCSDPAEGTLAQYAAYYVAASVSAAQPVS